MDRAKEKLLKKTYQIFLDSFTKMDVSIETMKEIVSEDIMGFGTTIDERVFNFSGYLDLVNLQRTKSEGSEINFERKPIYSKVTPDGNLAIFVEELKIIMLFDGSKNIIPLRVTTALSFYNNNWKVIHWHGSQAVETEEDTWHKEEWRRKNEELQKLVELKIADLKSKNRELEIEAALERVRAKTMAMHQSVDLKEVVAVLYQQVSQLNTAAWGCGITIFNEKENYLELWISLDVQGIHPKSYKILNQEHSQIRELWRIWKNQLDDQHIDLIGPLKTDYDDYAFTQTELRDLPPEIKNAIRSQPDSFASLAYMKCGLIALYDSTSSLSETSFLVLQRFAKVFDQAYTRFLDLQKAEAQAREAQIEGALERIRSRSMAMHKSDELQEVITVVFEQLFKLGIKTDAAHICILDDSKDINVRIATSDNTYSTLVNIPYSNNPVFKGIWESRKKDDILLELIYNQKKKNQFFKHLFLHSELKHIPEERKKFVLEGSGYSIVTVTFNFTGLYISKYVNEPYSKEEHNIFIRFGRVFEQTYTRFLDLQKAEEQAREAQIEAGLERVRAQSLAMHHSHELQTVVGEVLDQLKKLNMNMDAVQIEEIKNDPEAMNVWVANDQLPYGKRFQIKHLGYKLLKEYIHARDNGKVEFYGSMSKKSKNNYYKKAFEVSELRNIPEARKKQMFAGEGLGFYAAIKKHTSLHLLNFDRNVYSPREQKIVQKFAEVFEQAYIRFLDLQKAEDQAKEAQIEASLERIRSRSMAMHESNELKEVIACVFEQLQILDFVVPACSLIFYQEDLSAQHWFAGYSHDVYPESYSIPYVDNPYYTDMLKTWQKGRKFGEFIMKGKTKIDYAKWLLTESDFKNLPKEFAEQSGMLTPTPMYFADAFNKYGMVEVIGNESMPEDKAEVLIRISNVFEQTYTRFLDLQKAEAQAKEAQIEAALERVRARTMAMHQSEELVEVATVLYMELRNLDIREFSDVSIVIVDEKNNQQIVWGARTNPDYLEKAVLPLLGDETLQWLYNSWHQQEAFFTIKINGKKLQKHLNFVFPKASRTELEDQAIKKMPDPTFFHCAYFSMGYLELTADKELDENSAFLLTRFAKVFEQTYNRFLDLQKAEAQAREAQIEASLERVRSRTMAMHESDDLQHVVSVLYEQLDLLGLADWGCSIMIFDEDSNRIENWIAESTGSYLPSCYYVEGQNHPVYKKLWEYWKQQGPPMTLHHKDEVKREFDNYWLYETGFKALPENVKSSVLNEREVFLSYTSMRHGLLEADGYECLPQEKINILERFAKVFEQTYTRFLDLQKAEAQAREAQIEAALERVRSKAMAMHSSNDLTITAGQLFTELESLNIDLVRCGIARIYPSKEVELCTYSKNEEGVPVPVLGEAILEGHPVLEASFEGWETGKEYHGTIEGASLVSYYKAITAKFKLPTAYKKANHEKQYGYWFYFPVGCLYTFTKRPLSEDELEIYRKFNSVVGLTYKRYIDLQRAEGQAREAQIEAALERVRARTMAMHKSDELSDAALVLYSELKSLGISRSFNCGYVEVDEGQQKQFGWMSNFEGGEINGFVFPLEGDPIFNARYKAWKERVPVFQQEIKGEARKRHLKFALPFLEGGIAEMTKTQFPDPTVIYCCNFSHGYLHIVSDGLLSDQEVQLLIRFTQVFEQTYTRFLDLQKAEEQAHEAQIEAALERVRAKAMSMQRSQDLAQITDAVLEELVLLNMEVLRCGIGIMNEKSEEIYVRTTTGLEEGRKKIYEGNLDLTIHTHLEKSFNAWKEQKPFSFALEGKYLESYYQAIAESEIPIPIEVVKEAFILQRQYFYTCPFPAGILWVFNKSSLKDEDIKIIHRLVDVFNLAYTRFEDLQTSESRALEAIKQTSLDRVRGEIASMRTTNDLKRITPLIWKELTTLGVPFIRCGVFIMDEENKIIQSHLSSPDGKSLGLLNLPFEADKVGNNAVNNWRKGKIYKDHWNRDQFVKFMKKMVKLGRLDNPEMYQGAASPPESLDLHFVPFKQGMLYVGNTSPLEKEGITLVQSLAEAFSIAYARYEDFTQLEHAKNQIENALGELKSTQTQLIHAEKMASLGELTAGIAHEIQNPLNFVNNFSEVSKELIEEMNEELDIGNLDDVKEITDDIKQNLDKINHHGQRASSIVKGMLEHSRTGTKEKELTDINVLSDEYLRLAYHGLRAKDKSFNAEFNIELDDKLPKVKVMSQDMGRVLLNLINNAFYAVSKRSKEGLDGYIPTVSVSTRMNDKILEISVQDNGGGIPTDVIDKIFQPFFTTKPTGQGTGLGLSLSYDIITKGHDGHLEVESEEGMGTRFIAQLPII